jgi:hypothetical protein
VLPLKRKHKKDDEASSSCLLEQMIDQSGMKIKGGKDSKRHRRNKISINNFSRLDQSAFQQKASLPCTINEDPQRVF